MSKAILIIDMPNSCNECKIRFDDEYSNWCPYDNPEPNGVWKYVENGTKPNWCPLKSVPEKQKISPYHFCNNMCCTEREKGWNDCINEILGG
jgi:hypothetical protein